jgi:hypothetical protein
MASVDKDNTFQLIINDSDPILARYEYLIWFLEQYEGEYIDNCIDRIRESMFWYALAFGIDQPMEQE